MSFLLLLLHLASAQDYLGPGRTLEVHQVAEWEYYAVPLDHLEPMFWTVTIEVQSASAPVAMMLRRDQAPAIDQGNAVADDVDYVAWRFNQSHHTLFYRPFSLPTSTLGFLGIYSPRPCHYVLQLSSSQFPTCPSKCSSHGVCRLSTCYCDLGYAGVDCRLKVSEVQESGALQVEVAAGAWSLARLRLPSLNYDSDAVLRLQQVNASTSVELWARAGTGGEATFPVGNCTFGEGTDGDSISVQVGFARGEKVVFMAVLNKGVVGVIVELQASVTGEYDVDTSNSLVISLTVTIAGVCLGLIVGFLFYHYYKRQVRGKTQIDGISLVKLNLLFPVQSLQDLRDSRLPGNCDYCDREVTQEWAARVLPCGHIFHVKCIDPWLADHTVTLTQTCALCEHDCLAVTLDDSHMDKSSTDLSDGKAGRPGTQQSCRVDDSASIIGDGQTLTTHY